MNFLHFYPYGTALALSACLSILLTAVQAKRFSLKGETVFLLAPFCLLLGTAGAKLLYCLFCGPALSPAGGYLLYGAIAGCALAALFTARITRQNTGTLLDAMAAPGALMLALSRLAEGLVPTGYGWPIGEWFSIDAWDPSEYTGMSLFHLEDVSFFERFPFAVADPVYGEYSWSVFLLETIYALAVTIILFSLSEKRPGSSALLFLLMLSALQCFFESARQDAVIRIGFVRVNQVISAALVIALSSFFALSGTEKSYTRLLRVLLPELAMVGILVSMEFALEKKITAIAFIPMDVCYFISLLSCTGMILTALPQWKRSREICFKKKEIL